MPASPKVAPSTSYSKSDPKQRYTKRPGTIWNEIYGVKTLQEIKAENPFASPDWLNNTAKFSSKRRSAVDELFLGRDELDLSEIRRRSQNKGRYAAFRAIAHGIAKWDAHMEKLIKV